MTCPLQGLQDLLQAVPYVMNQLRRLATILNQARLQWIPWTLEAKRCIALYWAFIASHRESDAGPHITLLASDSSIQCISLASAKRCDAMHYNLVASVCIAFRYNADAMHRFFDAMPMQCIAFSMRYQYMAIYRIASHRFTVATIYYKETMINSQRYDLYPYSL
ncbi:hypothetical protein PGT21_011341 [Puccinia graminis f. sp. tritici]|uniref:Uncharacterized protein n=1 Tax=Puccinia graminis f. sp. tritici TaxID=56615 RepID=A0A5B0QHW6_PUCGR|nr:hypothetical protein PGT21_011341 [Puccinia graminis f. sp. tritici]